MPSDRKRWKRFGVKLFSNNNKKYLLKQSNDASNSLPRTFELRDSCKTSESPLWIYKVAARGNLTEFEELIDEDPTRLATKDSKGWACLHHAAAKGRVQIIQSIVSNGGDLNIQDNQQNTALHIAVEKSQTDVIDVLIKLNADTTILNDKQMAPIHVAAMHGLTKSIKALVQHAGIDTNLRGENGVRPLHYAAAGDHDETIKLLIENGAKSCAPCDNGYYAIHVAAKCANAKALEAFIQHATKYGYAREQVLAFVDKENNMPLHSAVNSGNMKAVEVCLNAGAKVDAQQLDKSTPLHFACSQGNLSMIKKMFDKQSDRFRNALSLTDVVGMTPLHRAALYNHYVVVGYLTEKGADFNAKDDEERTPLLVAASKCALETIRTLLKAGADIKVTDKENRNILHVAIKFGTTLHISKLEEFDNMNIIHLLNQQDIFGCTPLHYASKEGYLTALDELLKLGANISPRNNNQSSPFHFAAKYGRYNTCKRLLDSQMGPNIINETDKHEHTAIHIAAQNGHHKIVSLLLRRGAVITRDAQNKTPLHHAAENGYSKCIQLLLRFHGNLLESTDLSGDSALHTAAKAGHASTVSLLLTMGASFVRNKEDKTFFDYILENQQSDVAVEVVRHERWEEAVSLDSSCYGNVMVGLVQMLPDVCMAVLDRCETPSNHDKNSRNYHIDYNFQYLQCSHRCQKKIKEKGAEFMPMRTLNTMVQFGRVNCLSHPVCVTYLKMKWKAYGWFVYMMNFLIYVTFLAMLTYFTTTADIPRLSPIVNGSHNSSISRRENGEIEMTGGRKMIIYALAVFCSLNFIKEFVQIFQQKWKYFFDMTNYLEWILYISSSLFICPFLFGESTDNQWEAGAVAMFLAWINCLLFLQRFDFFGIYIVMFLEILQTLLQVLFVFSILIIAFGLSFYILLSNEESKAYQTPALSILRAGIMMVELDYMASFNDPLNDDDPHTLHFARFSMILLVLFVLLMPILLINLLIGLAVGDIESIQRNARLKKLAMQVELHTDMEKKIIPLKILKRVDKIKYTIYPNDCMHRISGIWERFTWTHSEQEVEKDKNSEATEFFVQELFKQKMKIKDISQTLQKQYDLLRLIVQKMEIHTEDDNQDEGGICQTSHSNQKCNKWSSAGAKRSAMCQNVVSHWKKSVDM